MLGFLKRLLFVFCSIMLISIGCKRSRKKIQTEFSGIVGSRLKWKQIDTNLVVTSIDISKHEFSSPPVIFTSLASSRYSRMPKLEIDMSFMDDFQFKNLTGKFFPDPEFTSKEHFAMFLSDNDSNVTAASANSANYKLRYLAWTKDHPSEEALVEKYDDYLTSKDYHALAPMSYLNFLSLLLKEDMSVIKPILGKDYVKV